MGISVFLFSLIITKKSVIDNRQSLLPTTDIVESKYSMVLESVSHN